MYSAKKLNTTMRFIYWHSRLTGFALMYFLLFFHEANGQTKVPCNEITADMGFTVRSVHIMGRWVPEKLQAKVEQLIGLGGVFDPPRISPAIELVRNELINTENAFAIRLIGSTSVLYIDSDVCDVSDSMNPKQAQVVIRAYYLRIDLYNLGRNILPMPRSAKPTFFREVPSALLATYPVFGFLNDRQYGPSVSLQTTTDLLQVWRIKNDNSSTSFRLNANLDIRKSLTNPFHTLGVNLDLVHPVYADTSIGWNIGVSYEQNQQPLAKGRYNRELFRMYGSIQGNFKIGVLKKYEFGGSARFLKNQYSVDASTELENPENGFEIFVLADGRLLKGFSRMGVWFDAGIPQSNNALKSYKRLAGRLGYGIVLGSGHTNADLEATLGAGYTWGSPQAYSQYFAGNTTVNFLYQSFTSLPNRVSPEGPLVRSLGEREGSLSSSGGVINGGRSYWHLNLNISIPFSSWSRPLIPDIVISDEPRVMTLRSALKGQVRSAKNFILDDLINNHGYPDTEQTEVVADRIIDKDIRPTLDYLADRANIYSIKPLLLLDIAQISDPVFKNKTWFAAGMGVQVNIVIARLEMGYMQTLSPASDSGSGNLFVRFILQNFY